MASALILASGASGGRTEVSLWSHFLPRTLFQKTFWNLDCLIRPDRVESMDRRRIKRVLELLVLQSANHPGTSAYLRVIWEVFVHSCLCFWVFIGQFPVLPVRFSCFQEWKEGCGNHYCESLKKKSITDNNLETDWLTCSFWKQQLIVPKLQCLCNRYPRSDFLFCGLIIV